MEKNFFFLVLTFFLIVTCSTMNKEQGKQAKSDSKTEVKPAKPQVSIESKQLAAREESTFVTEIKFKKGQKAVPKSARSQLSQLYQKAQKKGEIEGVKVITWGDQEYPSVHTTELTKKQRKLVEDRNDNLETYLEKLDKNLGVDKFSMAERPDLMARLFSTEDAKLKKSLEKAGIPDTDSAVKAKGKSSTSIVIFTLKQQD
jgi:murein L,D-transpeptidase YcbB/YkuD